MLVETERGTELGTVVTVASRSDRPAAARCSQAHHSRRERGGPGASRRTRRAGARGDAGIPRARGEQYKLDMKPVDVEYLFDGDKIVFYFSAEERVDFRELVRELASRFKARIDMRQVGVRDEARMVGGVGPLRPDALLRAFRRRVPARFDPDGQGAGPAAEPLEDKRALRQTHVLSALRVRRLQGLQVPGATARGDRRDARRLAKVTDLNTPKETVTMRLEDGTSVTVPLCRDVLRKGQRLSVLGEPGGVRGGDGPVTGVAAVFAERELVESEKPEREGGPRPLRARVQVAADDAGGGGRRAPASRSRVRRARSRRPSGRERSVRRRTGPRPTSRRQSTEVCRAARRGRREGAQYAAQAPQAQAGRWRERGVLGTRTFDRR